MSHSPLVIFLFALITLATHIPFTGSLPQRSFSTPSTPTSTQSLSDTHAVACATGGGDWHMDPTVALRLSNRFCTHLTRPENFPLPGIRVEDTGYPTDLGDTLTTRRSPKRRGYEISEFGLAATGLTNTTLIEIDGGITEFAFIRSYTRIVSSSLHISGTDEQCARDNCTEIFKRAINTCKFNTHHLGGMAMLLSDCGLYTVMVQNCSGNYVDPDCRRWHARWPGVG